MIRGNDKTEEAIREFLAENFILDQQGGRLDASESLTGLGVLDSMGVLELIMFIEEEFNIKVPDEDTLPENLDSVAGLVSYIERRRNEAVPA